MLTPTSDTERSSEQSWVSPDASGLFFYVYFLLFHGDDMGRGWVGEICHVRVGFGNI